MKRKGFEEIRPLIIAYGYVENSSQMCFIVYDKEIVIEDYNELLGNLLPLCNGISQFEEIIKKLENNFRYKRKSLIAIMEVLIENEIIVDSSEFYWTFHRRSMNPSLYFHEISEVEIADILKRRNYKSYDSGNRINLSSLQGIDSDFLEFITQRKSVRTYSSRDMSFDKIAGLLKAAYGVVRREDYGYCTVPHRTVPSGGALYPLEIYVVNLLDIDCLAKGLYYFQKEKEYLVSIKSGDFQDTLKGLLLDVNEIVESASLFLIVTACFARECEKYSNRGYRHILLEAGHLAQNIYLYCIDQNLGTVELSGFWDEGIANFLEIDIRNEAPIIVLAVGPR